MHKCRSNVSGLRGFKRFLPYICFTPAHLSNWRSVNNREPVILTISFYPFTSFRFLWPCIVSKLWSERENQQYATVRCLLSTLSQHVSGIVMPIFRRTKTVCYCTWCAALVLLDVVGSGCGALPCGVRALWRLLFDFTVLTPYNSAPHNRYQPHPAEPAQHTTCSNTRLVLLKMGIMMSETCWGSIDNKHLTVAYCWFSLSLHPFTSYTFSHKHFNDKNSCIFLRKLNL